jgi:hypothetical protein
MIYSGVILLALITASCIARAFDASYCTSTWSLTLKGKRTILLRILLNGLQLFYYATGS